MSSDVNSTIYLPYLFCYFLDGPTLNETHSINFDESYNNQIVCSVNSSFHTGGSITDTSSTGQKVSVFIWMLILIFGFLGTLNNSLIILILRKQHSAKSFEILLAALAYFDLICSIMTILSSTGIIAFFRKIKQKNLRLLILQLYIFSFG